MYYFTFGIRGQLFNGGWVRINANTLKDAQHKFIKRYGDRAFKEQPNVLNYAFDYDEESFKMNIMKSKGNFGAFEHEYIA